MEPDSHQYRRLLRRARNTRIQFGAWRKASISRETVPRESWREPGPNSHRESGQGSPILSGVERRVLVEEPPRTLRHYWKVSASSPKQDLMVEARANDVLRLNSRSRNRRRSSRAARPRSFDQVSALIATA